MLADTIPGIRVVKAFAQEKREAERFRAANEHNLAMNDKLNKTWSLFSPTVTLLTEIGLLVVWAFGIWQISKNEITVGVLTAFLAYIGRFYTPARFDEPHRLGHAARGLQHQAHLRHPRPRLQRARADQPGAPDQGDRPDRARRKPASATAPAP